MSMISELENPISSALEKIKSNLNWNYVGMVAGILTVLVTIRNINNYYAQLKRE